MKSGETVRYQCSVCDRELEITLEPKDKDNKEAERGLDEPQWCPWCTQALEEV